MLIVIVLGLVILFVIRVFIFQKNNKGKSILANNSIRILILSILVLLTLWVIDSLFLDGFKSYYCVSDDKCVTVWKMKNGEALIIKGKYKGRKVPSDNYIKTTNTQYLTLYFNSDIPNKMIVRNQGSSTGVEVEYKIINNSPENLIIVEYSDEYKDILYKPDAKKFNDVKINTEYIDLNIKENYATDRTGKKIK